MFFDYRKKNNNFKQKKLKAFTLIELTISLFIITILVSLIVINYNVGFSGSNLINSQSFLYTNIRLAQSYALSYRSYNGSLPQYWGVNLKTGETDFAVFADMNGNYLPDINEVDPIFGAKTVFLPQDILINHITWNTSEISILFEPGSGQMVIYNIDQGLLDYYNYHIELKDKNFDIGNLVGVFPPVVIDLYSCSCSDITIFCCSFCTNTDNCIDFGAI